MGVGFGFYVDGANIGALNNISDESLEFGDITQTRKVYKEAVLRTFEAYRSLGVKVAVVLQVPHQNINVKRFLEGLLATQSIAERIRLFDKASSMGVTRDEHLDRQKIASSKWKELSQKYSNCELIVIDPTSSFCDDDRCAFITEDFAIYTDFDHASEKAYDRLEVSFEKALGF